MIQLYYSLLIYFCSILSIESSFVGNDIAECIIWYLIFLLLSSFCLIYYWLISNFSLFSWILFSFFNSSSLCMELVLPFSFPLYLDIYYVWILLCLSSLWLIFLIVSIFDLHYLILTHSLMIDILNVIGS